MDIQEYTIEQVTLFYKVITKLELQIRASTVMDHAVAFHAESKKRKDYCEKLNKAGGK